jgi:hypothetical protein
MLHNGSVVINVRLAGYASCWAGVSPWPFGRIAGVG